VGFLSLTGPCFFSILPPFSAILRRELLTCMKGAPWRV
jgi:hypothetical protein